jgi:hypothetical protein
MNDRFEDGRKVGKLEAALELRKFLRNWPARTNEDWHKELSAVATELEAESPWVAAFKAGYGEIKARG